MNKTRDLLEMTGTEQALAETLFLGRSAGVSVDGIRSKSVGKIVISCSI
jgi:hypothetical protein